MHPNPNTLHQALIALSVLSLSSNTCIITIQCTWPGGDAFGRQTCNPTCTQLTGDLACAPHLGGLGLADAGAASEEHGRDGPARVLEPRARAPHSARQRPHRLALPCDALLRSASKGLVNAAHLLQMTDCIPGECKSTFARGEEGHHVGCRHAWSTHRSQQRPSSASHSDQAHPTRTSGSLKVTSETRRSKSGRPSAPGQHAPAEHVDALNPNRNPPPARWPAAAGATSRPAPGAARRCPSTC